MARIQVEGNGKAAAFPEEIELQLTVTSAFPEYGQVIADLDRKVTALKDAFVACGVERTAIKTKDFSVNTEREYAENGTPHFSGYSATHEMLLRFPVDRDHLNALLAVCPGSEATPDIDIRFKVHSNDALQLKALEAAFSAARKSAELLAKSSGCVLGDLIEVLCGERRSPGVQTYRVRQETSHIDFCQISYAKEIEPDDIECSETVSVTWDMLANPTNVENDEMAGA
jgi:uncharacterized protein YggE